MQRTVLFRAFRFVIFLVCTPYQVLSAQTDTVSFSLQEYLITFDRLSKTIIAFSSPEEPHISVTPLPRSIYSIKALGNGMYNLIFESRIKEGIYTIKVTSASETKSCLWRVFRTQLDQKNVGSYSDAKCFFGNRLNLSSRLPEGVNLPSDQFKIDYKIGNAPKMLDAPYSETWYGPRVLASAKTVQLDLVWVYPPTGERVPLLSKTMIPTQEAPEIDCINVETNLVSDSTLKELEKKGKISREKKHLEMLDARSLQEIFITIKGIRLHKEVPINADERDPFTQKVFFAQAEDIEIVNFPSIQYESPSSNLRIISDKSTEELHSFAITTTNTRCVESVFLPNEKEFRVVIAVTVPTFPLPENPILKGSLEFQQKIKIFNRIAHISAESFLSSCIVNIVIPYDRNTSKSEPERCWSTMHYTFSIEEKTPNVPAEEICAQCTQERLTSKAVVYHAWKVISPALRDEVQAAFVLAGKIDALKPLPKTTPLIVLAKKQTNSYGLVAMLFGKQFLTVHELRLYLPSEVKSLLRKPIVARLNETEDSVIGTKKGYLYEVLSEKKQKKILEDVREAVYKEVLANPRQYLRDINNYELGGFALFEVDSATLMRFRETFTPSLPRTHGLEEAEKMCMTMQRIKMQIEAGQRVPQAWIDEGGSPQDCEVVKTYYTSLHSLVRINKVILVVNLRNKEPDILAAISISMPKNCADSLEATILHDCLLVPLSTGFLLKDGLRQFTTQEFETNIETGKMIPVKGSIPHSSQSTLYEHLLTQLKQGWLRNRTADVMPLPGVSRY